VPDFWTFLKTVVTQPVNLLLAIFWLTTCKYINSLVISRVVVGGDCVWAVL